MIEIHAMCKSYPEAGEILHNIDLVVNKGDVIAVVGPSGGGKTTLLRCMNFLETPDSGELKYNGKRYDLKSITKKEINEIRKHTGFVFQNYNLFLNKTALGNVMESLIIVRKLKRGEAEEKAKKALIEVGLGDKFDFYPNQLSGGQQQRVSIARAIALDPDVIYFDEPTSALDPELTQEVLDVITKLAQQGRTMMIVTHELSFAEHAANRIVFMDSGQLSEEATPHAFFNDPQNQRIKQFLEKSKNKKGV